MKLPGIIASWWSPLGLEYELWQMMRESGTRGGEGMSTNRGSSTARGLIDSERGDKSPMLATSTASLELVQLEVRCEKKNASSK